MKPVIERFNKAKEDLIRARNDLQISEDNFIKISAEVIDISFPLMQGSIYEWSVGCASGRSYLQRVDIIVTDEGHTFFQMKWMKLSKDGKPSRYNDRYAPKIFRKHTSFQLIA